MADKPEFSSIVALLSASSAAIGVVEKKERNKQGEGFNFRGIDTVVNATSPEFREHGIIVTPETLERTYEQIEVGSKRTLMGHVMLRVRYTFHGPAGDSLAATVDSEAFDSGDKATSKAMSIALRTALLQVLMLPTDEADPDASSYERSPGTAAAAPKAPAAPAHNPSDPGAFVMPFGTKNTPEYRGKTLAAIDAMPEGHGFIVWVAEKSTKDQTAKDAACAYLEEQSRIDEEPMAPLTPLGDDEEIPF